MCLCNTKPQNIVIGWDEKKMSVKLWIFSYPSILTYVLDAQKNNLIDTVL